jgi:uncharacterized membrane protein
MKFIIPIATVDISQGNIATFEIKKKRGMKSDNDNKNNITQNNMRTISIINTMLVMKTIIMVLPMVPIMIILSNCSEGILDK